MTCRAGDLPTVCSPIETLALGRTFGVVLLASTMINTEPVQRRAFLATCRRHLDGGGVVVIQQTAPGWFDTVGPGEKEVGGIRRVIRSARREGQRIDLVVEYHAGGRMWTHAFSPHQIGEQELAADLASARLRFGRWLTGDRSWLTAHATP